MDLRKVQDLDLKDKKVFLRLDLNVPIKNGKIQDDTRITEALPTIKYLLERTNRVCIASHLGRPKGTRNEDYSLEPVGQYLAELLGREVVFLEDYSHEEPGLMLSQLGSKQFMMLQNLRFYPGEEKDDKDFARHLAAGFDDYVDDAFGAVHRAHASVAALPECFPPEHRAAGFLIQKEVQALDGILHHPATPFTVVMGGAKVSDKIDVIMNLLQRCNNILIGGAMAYTFMRYRGIPVGSSKVEEDKLPLVDMIFRNAEARKVKILLPVDHVGARAFAEHAEPIMVESSSIPDGVIGLDIGYKTTALYCDVIRASQTVLWNGPMGVFEWPAYARGTMAIAQAVAACPGKTVVGGGDSVAAVNMAGVARDITHISTGGGASLEYLEGRTLPGLKVLEK